MLGNVGYIKQTLGLLYCLQQFKNKNKIANKISFENPMNPR